MRDLIARLATVIVACMLVGVALIAALGFAMVGVYFLFAQIASPPWAAFDSALAAIVFSLIVAGIALLLVRRPRSLAQTESGIKSKLRGGDGGRSSWKQVPQTGIREYAHIDLRVFCGRVLGRRQPEAARIPVQSNPLNNAAIPPPADASEGMQIGS